MMFYSNLHIQINTLNITLMFTCDSRVLVTCDKVLGQLSSGLQISLSLQHLFQFRGAYVHRLVWCHVVYSSNKSV